jgi:hypothetical protein
MPWEIVCVDVVGPWSVNTTSGIQKFNSFTAIDPATEAGTIMDTFHNNWLCRYPRPI